MTEVPENLKYTSDHEWLRLEDDGTVTLGITEHAQQALGELVYVELPEADRELEPGEACAVVESVKAASDVYSPLAGVVAAANDALADTPELVNDSPYADGWLLQLRPADPQTLEELMDADAYTRFLAESED
ncbi:MAG: glycine cleavage system protein GcvH [Chromatiales bacterium]|nr:MAG: glycine cleavage system protein GcvH [Chromatiales bacterium]